MSDIEARLCAAMHSAVDGQEASPDELITQVLRRHRLRTRRLAGAAVLAAVAIAVPTVMAVHSTIGRSARHPAGQVTTKLPTRMSGLPMPTSMNFEFLIGTERGAAWYSTATRRTEPIAGLPSVFAGYQFGRVWGGWAARAVTYNSPCSITECAGPPATFYFIPYGSTTATRIGKAYAQDGVNPGSRAGTMWLVTYPRSSTSLFGSSFAQLVNTVGQPLGPRYRLPANYLMGRGVGKYLLLDLNTDESQFELWDPATGQVLGHFSNVVAQGPEQVVWTKGCQRCPLEITNVSTGKPVTTSIPGMGSDQPGKPGNLSAAVSDDGRLLAVQVPGHELDIVNADTGSMTRITGTALNAAEFESFDWQNEGHRLIITAGPNAAAGPDQIAYWQPGETHLRVATIRNRHELPEIETGAY
jgi:hypothetical protein